eukprot:8645271-Pyramimonas_sp.AAC.1
MIWGHQAYEGCAAMGVEGACGRWHWGIRWSCLWGHETCEGCADMGVGSHVNGSLGAFLGALYGVTKR